MSESDKPFCRVMMEPGFGGPTPETVMVFQRDEDCPGFTTGDTFAFRGICYKVLRQHYEFEELVALKLPYVKSLTVTVEWTAKG